VYPLVSDTSAQFPMAGWSASVIAKRPSGIMAKLKSWTN